MAEIHDSSCVCNECLEMNRLVDKIERSNSLLSYEPTCSDIQNACLSFRHDFGLLSDLERRSIELEAREWLRAWGHTLPQFKIR